MTPGDKCKHTGLHPDAIALLERMGMTVERAREMTKEIA